MFTLNGQEIDTKKKAPHPAPTEDVREQLYKLIRARQSIRLYQKKPVSKALLTKIIEAGFHAPSGKNSQNWRFFVLTGKKKEEYLAYSQKAWMLQKESLEKRLKPSLYRFTERFFYTLGNAPVVIFAYAATDPDVHEKSLIGAVYMALENIILASVAEGLGSCTMGAPLKIKDEINQFLDIEKHEQRTGEKLELVCSLVLGYPDHEPPKSARKLENRITWLNE